MAPIRRGIFYEAAAGTLGIAFLRFGVTFIRSKASVDARRLLFASIVYLPLLFIAMVVMA
jgi:heme O synthase-like polyprenyltransferase